MERRSPIRRSPETNFPIGPLVAKPCLLYGCRNLLVYMRLDSRFYILYFLSMEWCRVKNGRPHFTLA